MRARYDTRFFDAIREGAKASADVIVPLVLSGLDVKRVADIGCGEGWVGKRVEDAGCSVVGYDGPYVENPVIPFEAVDLEKPGSFVGEQYDLAVCLEVAEHLSPERAESFVADLCAVAPLVLFSAAIPGQGGNHHVNCQWPTYWNSLFARHEFWMSDGLRWPIWDDVRVEAWYRQNLMFAWRGDQQVSLTVGVRDVVHPEIWAWK